MEDLLNTFGCFFKKKNMDQDLPSSSGEVYLKGYIGS